MNKRKIYHMLPIAATALVCCSPLYGALAIYEPFADGDSTLVGNDTGTGLTGPWGQNDATYEVVTGLTYGALDVSGYSIQHDATGRSGGTASISATALSSQGLLDNGSTLWFSVLVAASDSIGLNDRWIMALGSGSVHGGNESMSGDGEGIGFIIDGSGSGKMYATTWSSGNESKQNVQTGVLSGGDTSLVVGKVTWGATDGDNDTIEIYMPGTDLALPASPVSTAIGDLEQDLMDTLVISGKDYVQYDEIRFGSSYADVTLVPEPSTSALIGLSGLALIFRRRK